MVHPRHFVPTRRFKKLKFTNANDLKMDNIFPYNIGSERIRSFKRVVHALDVFLNMLYIHLDSEHIVHKKLFPNENDCICQRLRSSPKQTYDKTMRKQMWKGRRTTSAKGECDGEN